MDELVTTTGRGAVTAAPDAMRVSMAVEVTAASVADAFAALSDATRQAGEAARRHTDTDRISSRGFSVHPAHDREGRPAGYTASNALRIVCALTVSGDLVTDLGRSVGDALRVHEVAPVVTDTTALVAQARDAAFADARSAAEQLAGLAGRRLGRVLEVRDGGDGHDDVPMAVAASRGGMTFEPGSTEVGATVTVRWALED
jgi:uncharacterized protein